MQGVLNTSLADSTTMGTGTPCPGGQAWIVTGVINREMGQGLLLGGINRRMGQGFLLGGINRDGTGIVTRGYQQRDGTGIYQQSDGTGIVTRGYQQRDGTGIITRGVNREIGRGLKWLWFIEPDGSMSAVDR